MVDVVDKVTRSRMMAGIRSGNTKPEIAIRKGLHKLGYRFRLNSKVRNIKPDVVLRRRKIAIFAHGCYWHQHDGCQLAYSDRSYSDSWINKFEQNQQRDLRVSNQLLEMEWRVAVIWECATRDEKVFADVLSELHKWIECSDSRTYESGYRKRAP